MATGAHFGCPKFIFDLAISDRYTTSFFFEIFDKMAAVGPILDVRNSLLIAFLAILDKYWILFCLKFFTKWPPAPILDMSEIHFQSHFWPFQIDMQLSFFFLIFDIMAAVVHFGCPKFTFSWISGHFRSIRNFFLVNFWQNGCHRPFGCVKFTFDHISGHFRSIQIFFVLNFLQNGHRRTFWMFESHFLLSCFYCISGHFRSIGHFECLKFTFNAILAILDQCRIFFFGGHFGSPKITFDCISGHFWSIGHFGCPKFTFDGISGHPGTPGFYVKAQQFVIYFLF